MIAKMPGQPLLIHVIYSGEREQSIAPKIPSEELGIPVIGSLVMMTETRQTLRIKVNTETLLVPAVLVVISKKLYRCGWYHEHGMSFHVLIHIGSCYIKRFKGETRMFKFGAGSETLR